MPLRVVNRFSWHGQPGDFAERYLRNVYFPSLGLRFRKIRKDKQGPKPDGYVLQNGRKIALIEIKLVTLVRRARGVQRITVSETVRTAIRQAKRQLGQILSKLPRIIYLIRDEPFFRSETAKCAIFGEHISVDRGGRRIYDGYAGFYPPNREDNKFRDGALSGVICFVPGLRNHNYELWIYRNRVAPRILRILLDGRHVREFWDATSNGLRSVR